MQCRRRRLAPPLSALARSMSGAGIATAAEIAGRAPRGHRRRFGGGHCRSRGLRRRAALRSGFTRRLLLGRLFRRRPHGFPLLTGRSGLLLLFGGPFLRFCPLCHDGPPDPCKVQNSCCFHAVPSIRRALRTPHPKPRLCSAACRRRVHRRVCRRLRPMLPQHRRTRPASSPVDQLDRMDRRKLRARCDLHDATKIAGCDHVRSQSLDSPDFTLAQPPCDVRLQNIVGPRRTAA